VDERHFRGDNLHVRSTSTSEYRMRELADRAGQTRGGNPASIAKEMRELGESHPTSFR
jgi:hypothetical protein